MKHTICIAILLLFISCQESTQEFKGVGNLELDTDFKKLPKHSEFQEVLDGEYHIANYQMSKDIGNVSQLYITTENDLIREVEFTSNKNTDTIELNKIVANLIKPMFESPQKKLHVNSDLRFYFTPDSTIIFTIQKMDGDKNKYSYFSKETAMKKATDTYNEIKNKNSNVR